MNRQAALTKSEVDVLHRILAQLRNKGVACIYITHKLKELLQIADRVTVLRDGKTVATQSIDECTEEKTDFTDGRARVDNILS